MPDLDDLVRRLDDLEDRLRGDAGEPIDLRSLPLARLQNHLEAEWLPSAPRVIEPKSITAEEIGELPSAVVSTATDNGVVTTQLIPNAITTWIRFKDVEEDTLGIQAVLSGKPAGSAYTTLWCRQPGMYLVSGGGEFGLIAANTHTMVSLRVGRAGTAAGAETGIAHQQGSTNAAGGFADTPAYNLSRLIRLAENDHVCMTVHQDSGAGKTFGGNTQTKEAFLSMTWVSA